MQNLLSYRSLTYAQRAARTLERAGITGTVTRMPKAFSEKGCGYAVIVRPLDTDRALSLLKKNGLRPERIYDRVNGELREASYDLS